jgi:hypothetical protein
MSPFISGDYRPTFISGSSRARGHAVTVDHSAQERAEPTFGELSFRCPVNERTVSTGI